MVFEFNKDSPLITYQASKEIHAGNYSKALDMLSTATVKYPDHLTAHIFKALALAHNENFSEAREIIFNLKGSLLTDETINYYLKEIDKIERESRGISVSLDDTVSQVLNESFIEEEQFEADKDFGLLDDEFVFKESKKGDEGEESSIVTETLAEIYASQQNFDEALDIYEKLKKLKPEMEEKFNNRISELKTSKENKKIKKFEN